MGSRTVIVVVLAAGIALGGLAPAASADSSTPPPVPPRTAISLRTTTGISWGTPNEHESRSALSLAKLFIADYALRHGDGSATDRDLAERMIRYSDDGAASQLEARYPQAITEIAAEYQLSRTRPAGTDWGAVASSTADVTEFLAATLRTHPDSPLLEWMAQAGATAADGTEQDWGTARLPWVTGTKWGWSDFGESEVASTSYGPGFAVTAHTRGTAAEQTADVLDALPLIAHELLRRPL